MGLDSYLPLKKSGQSVIHRNLPYRFLRGQIEVGSENKEGVPPDFWRRELEAARKLGEDMFDLDGRIIDAESSHRPSPVKQKNGRQDETKKGCKATTKEC